MPEASKFLHMLPGQAATYFDRLTTACADKTDKELGTTFAAAVVDRSGPRDTHDFAAG